MDWIQAIQLVGVPVVILIAIATGFVRACRWCAPRVDRFLAGHQQLLDKTAEIQSEIKALVLALGRRLEDHEALQLARLEDIRSKVERLSESFSSSPSFEHRKGA